ncbi:MAG: RNA polymerase sigma factor [Planctomycetes bacterium]|nr:RNA polymerase sigma factor [Planctomycetota bacterium]
MFSLRSELERPPTPAALGECHCDDAFQALLEPHLDLLHAVARGLLHSPDLACDAVQETLYALWTQAATPAELRGWLVRTTVHKCLHVLRREGRRVQHEGRAGAERWETCPLCDPAAPAEAQELRARLDAAIAELSDEQRTTFLLRSEQGLEYQEIAAALCIPIGTVRSRLKRARESLAQRLAV